MTKVLIVEDQRIHREYMETLLSQEGHYELLPSVTAADVAVQLCKTYPVQLVLMDIAVNGMMDGIEATAKLKDMSPNIKIIIVTSMLDTECLVNAKEAGADSIWYKDASEESLMDVIDRTMQGEHIFPDNSPAVHIGFARSDKFTKTEYDILREIVNGLSSRQISEKLDISGRTVDWHIKNLLEKTGLPNRTALAIRAAKGNLFVIKDKPEQDEKDMK